MAAPTAKECGSCHVDQYREWQQSSHSRAFLSTEYQEMTDNYGDESCLFCHIPGDIQDPEQQPRRTNREEGITCVSCHLHEKKMQGPHQSGALFTPHAIAPNPLLDARRNSAKLCAICHDETYDQWRESQNLKTYPTCLGCHGAQVERSHTQGTNFLSKILVSFEPQHLVRSHYMRLSSQSDQGVYPDLTIDRLDKSVMSITITNSLPHDLPTGSFGEKYIFATVNMRNGDGKGFGELTAMKRIELDSVLGPGESMSFRASLPDNYDESDIVIDLFRFHQSTQQADLIRTYTFPGGSH